MKKFNYLLLSSMFTFLIFQSCTDVPPKHDAPRQLISNEEAKQLNENYNSTRHRLISSTIEKEDANAIWYSLEELENYIYYIKKEGKNKG